MICAAVYFGVLYNLRGHLTVMTDVIMAVAAAVAVFGLVSVGDQGFNQIGGVSGSFGTHEALGSFLMLMLPITAAMGIFNKKDEKRRIIALAVSLLVTVCLAFSQSRSGWISELVALSVLALLASKYYAKNTAGNKQQLAAVVPFIAFAGVAGVVVAVSGSGLDVMHRASSFGLGSSDMSMHQRLMLWHAAVSMIAAKPLMGWGLGSFPYVASKFTAVAASGSYVAANGVNLHNIAHNYYLQLAAETGIVGLGLYVGMVATFFTVGVRALAKLKDGTRKMVLVGVLAAMAGQVVDSFTSPSYNVASVSLIQWMLMGVAMFAAGVPKQDEVAVQTVSFKTAQVPMSFKTGKILRGAAAAAAGLLVVTVMLSTASSATAETYGTTVINEIHHDRGVSSGDAWAIGIVSAVGGYFIGQDIEEHNHHDH
jgi:O-antigen ligase